MGVVYAIASALAVVLLVYLLYRFCESAKVLKEP